jgi:alanyl-tRNA synthetase
LTERIYYTAPYTVDFNARVVAIEDVGGRRAAVLDRTAFYPTSGGQPFDTGILGAARVIVVIDREDGAILHVFEGELPGREVAGRIDWARRFEHMQQHTGQHVLSAAFERFCRARTESFHLGAAAATIDLGRDVAPSEVALAETEANRVVWEDRPVTIRFADSDEAAALPLRKEPVRAGRLRLIEVDGFDLSACGGTHVARTGAIGVIAVSGWERFRGGTRVEFRCGGRALADYRAMRDSVSAAQRLLSTGPADLASAIQRLQGEARDAKRRVKDLQEQLAGHEAEALVDRATPTGSSRIVVEPLEGWDPAGLKTIAAAIVERPGHMAVLLTIATPVSIVVARAADVRLDAGAVLRQLTAKYGGKGGGRPELAQGGGLNGPADEIAAFARTLLASA